MSASAVEVTDLVSGYNGVAAVRGVSLTVGEGEVVALLGPNGAGKTTSLLTISGLLRPMEGTIRVFGESATRLAPYRLAARGLAHVPEDRALFTQLTVAENIRLGMRRGSDAKEVLLDYFPELERLMDRKAGLLSGGEQQMLAVGRALVARPKLLLVDEMSLGLAPLIVQRLLPVLPRVARESGTAVLFVEQHVELALENADRAYVLTRGEVAVQGAAAQLRQKREILEASYIGGSSQPAEEEGGS